MYLFEPQVYLFIPSFLEQIRAGHLSGDCHYKREFLRGFMKIRGHEQVSFSALVLNKKLKYALLLPSFACIVKYSVTLNSLGNFDEEENVQLYRLEKYFQ